MSAQTALGLGSVVQGSGLTPVAGRTGKPDRSKKLRGGPGSSSRTRLPSWAILGLFGGEIGTAFMQTFVRKREQIHSNLLGLHIDPLAGVTAFGSTR